MWWYKKFCNFNTVHNSSTKKSPYSDTYLFKIGYILSSIYTKRSGLYRTAMINVSIALKVAKAPMPSIWEKK